MKVLATTLILLSLTQMVNAQGYFLNLQPTYKGIDHGSGSATFSLSGTTFSVETSSFQGLGAGATDAELDIVVPDQGNDWVYTFTLNPSGSTSGSFTGSLTLTAQDIGYLNDGYFNVVLWYSNVFPSDQISGQIKAVPEPSTASLCSVSFLIVLASIALRSTSSGNAEKSTLH